jgi:hypothetical protein
MDKLFSSLLATPTIPTIKTCQSSNSLISWLVEFLACT